MSSPGNGYTRPGIGLISVGWMGKLHSRAYQAVPQVYPELKIRPRLVHAADTAAAKIPFIFDPGQGLPMFDGEELRAFVDRASWVAVNDYEAQMLVERTGRSMEEMSRSHLRGVVVTLGAHGCELWQQGVRTAIPGVVATEVVDPTGCGDAFRAALLYGLERGWSLADCARLGNRLGALKIASRGGQNHVLDRTFVDT